MMSSMNYMSNVPKALLTKHNAKTPKGEKRRYLTAILYLYPHKSFGLNVCPAAEAAGCHKTCLTYSGRLAMPATTAARLRKTWLFHNERDWFMLQLYRDIEALEKDAQRRGASPAVRLNGMSDIDWENILLRGKSMMEWFPNVQFYDYTKLPRVPKNRNYHLTFSYSPAAAFAKTVQKAARLGMSMAVVFDGPMPQTWNGHPVISGDEDDLRFLDPPGTVIGLKFKTASRDNLQKEIDRSNFIVRVA